jgi:hypothetical protein
MYLKRCLELESSSLVDFMAKLQAKLEGKPLPSLSLHYMENIHVVFIQEFWKIKQN